jgi:hypothetical protein
MVHGGLFHPASNQLAAGRAASWPDAPALMAASGASGHTAPPGSASPRRPWSRTRGSEIAHQRARRPRRSPRASARASDRVPPARSRTGRAASAAAGALARRSRSSGRPSTAPGTAGTAPPPARGPPRGRAVAGPRRSTPPRRTCPRSCGRSRGRRPPRRTCSPTHSADRAATAVRHPTGRLPACVQDSRTSPAVDESEIP